MSTRSLIITAVAMLVIGSATMIATAQAGVVGPASSVQSSAQTLDLIQKTRRICRRVMRCPKFLQCRWEQECYITADYPPEHRNNRR